MTPFEVAGWTEEEARAQFVKFRFAENGGEPFCGKCGCVAVSHYKCRPIYKCKGCGSQFSATSGTPWQKRKIKFRKLMYLIACFVDNVQAQTARAICRHIRVQYKTVLLWLHKLRAEIANRAATATPLLSGEVEVDGAYFGGYVRPKNQAKTRKDLRKIPYRANDRALCVVVARQRGDGPIRTWVGKNEIDTRPFVKDAVQRNSVVFTDMAPHWGKLRGKFKLFRINHKRAYCTPEACTNQAETLWALMRVMERVHRHISQNYLDLYAAEAAWTLQKGKRAEGEDFTNLMAWMSRPGRSPLAGYFQGRKRSLSLCKVDGTIEDWKPKPRKGTVTFIDKDAEPIEYKPRRPLAKTWREGFTFLSAEQFLAAPSLVPDHGGVYAVFVRGGQAIFGATGYQDVPQRPVWRHDDADHAYTGETYGLRTRILSHLAGDILVSNLRETLMALQWGGGALPDGPDVEAGRIQAERALTEWMKANILVGYRSCSYVKDVETAILDATASPFNLSRNNPSAYADALQDLRRGFRTDVVSGWAKPEGPVHPRVRR